MVDGKDILLQLIDEKRRKLIEIAEEKGFQHSETIKISEELDKLIVQFLEYSLQKFTS